MKLKLILVTYLITVLKNFSVIHLGTFTMKIKAVVKTGVLVSPFVVLMNKVTDWVILNSDYIAIVMLAVVIDHVLGTIKHLFKTKTFRIKKNVTGLLTKIGLVVTGGFLFEGLNHLVDSDAGTLAELTKDYLTITTRCVVFLYPAGSAFGNMSILSGGKFPPIGWMEKLKKFQQNLNVNEFKNPNPPTL